MLEVQVLLATYNGDKYIKDFFDSLLEQSDVRIHLIVSDDGSYDETFEIVKRYGPLFYTFKLLSGPKRGATENFIYLFNNRYPNLPVSFADQDDVWMKHKLKTALANLREDEPTLFYSRCEILGSKKIVPKNFQLRKYSHIFGNAAMGCTQVLNVQMCMLLEKNLPPAGVHIDWWTFILAVEENAALRWDEPLIMYRLHSSNVVGVPHLSARLSRIFGRLQKKRTLISWETSQILHVLGTYKTMTGRKPEIVNFLSNLSIIDIMQSFLFRYFRRSFFENFFVVLLVLEYKKTMAKKHLL